MPLDSIISCLPSCQRLIRKLLELQTTKDDISSKQIKKEISAPLNKTTFKELSEGYLQEIKGNGKLTRYASDKVRVDHLVRFAKK